MKHTRYWGPLLAASASMSACSDGPAPDQTAQVAQAINNGSPVSNADALRGPAVTMYCGNWMGSGVLLDIGRADGRSNAVLTAAHVVYDCRNRARDVSAYLGNAPLSGANGAVGRALTHHPHYDHNLGSGTLRNPDIAIVFLDRLLGQGVKPNCTAPLTDDAIVSAAALAPPDPRDPVKNTAVLPVTAKAALGDETTFWLGTSAQNQHIIHGDCGSGVYETATGGLVGIVNDWGTSYAQNHMGGGTALAPYCDSWLRPAMRSNPMTNPKRKLSASFDWDLDALPDEIWLEESDSQLALHIQSTSLGGELPVLAVALPVPSTFQAMALGNYSGAGTELALVGDNVLSTVGLDDGAAAAAAAPGDVSASLSLRPGVEYSSAFTTRFNNDIYDDLIAFTMDGGAEVFRGSDAGLEWVDGASFTWANVDNDDLQDPVVLSGAALSYFSVATGFRRLTVTDLAAGRQVVSGSFRSAAGVTDLALLGDGTLGRKFVSVCSPNSVSTITCQAAIDGSWMSGGRLPERLDVYDFDVDGFDDLQISYSNAPARIYWGSASGLTSSAWNPATDFPKPHAICEGDYDGAPPPPVEAAGETVAIVLDESGSMTTTVSDGGATRWDDAVSAAIRWVQRDRSSAALTTRSYAIYTFNLQSTDEDLRQVWPAPDSDDCSSVDPATGFCNFAPASTADYDDLILRLEAVRETHRPTWRATPLAGSLCDALEILRGFATPKRIILESDGGENATDTGHPCWGEPSAPFGSWDPTDPNSEWGMTTDSWEAKVVRRAARLDEDIATAVSRPLGASDALSPDLVWNVDLHYGAIEPAAATASYQFLASAGSSLGKVETSYEFFESPGGSLEPAGADATVSFSIMGAGEFDIDPGELDFFRALGGSTPGSLFTAYVGVPGTVYGTDHLLAGDVDDSGCVDLADFSIMQQTDVWLARAVPPLQIAMRADLDRDGWVGYGDLIELLNHWGSGCANPVPPRPVVQLPPGSDPCADGVQNGDETDVDCGGTCAACPDGAACLVGGDCESGHCSGNVCQAAPSFDLCLCRPSKCGDCTRQVSTCEATAGCVDLVRCTYESPCSFPHESCQAGRSCHQVVGYDQSSAAGQAANGLISCLGGC